VPCEIRDRNRRTDVAADVANGAGDGTRVAVVANEAAKHSAKRSHQQAVVDLLGDERTEYRRIRWRVGKRQVSTQGIEQFGFRPMRFRRTTSPLAIER
jgi:hypothetical protein